MGSWYVLQTQEKKEKEAVRLLERAVSHELWSECRVLRKIKVFRSGGILHLVDDVLFPGYLFIRTDCPGGLAEALERSREFPRLLSAKTEERLKDRAGGRQSHLFLGGAEQKMIAAVDPADLRFLQAVCGENLQRAMGVTRLVLSEDNRIIRADGVLSRYLDRIVRLNLHKRFAVVEVPLFNRIQPVLFGIRLEQDRAVV